MVTTDVKTYQVTRLKRSLLMISHFNEGNIKGFLKLRWETASKSKLISVFGNGHFSIMLSLVILFILYRRPYPLQNGSIFFHFLVNFMSILLLSGLLFNLSFFLMLLKLFFLLLYVLLVIRVLYGIFNKFCF